MDIAYIPLAVNSSKFTALRHIDLNICTLTIIDIVFVVSFRLQRQYPVFNTVIHILITNVVFDRIRIRFGDNINLRHNYIQIDAAEAVDCRLL